MIDNLKLSKLIILIISVYCFAYTLTGDEFSIIIFIISGLVIAYILNDLTFVREALPTSYIKGEIMNDNIENDHTMHSKYFVALIIDDRLMGHKNVYCPDYEHCLDLHCNNNDNYWVCNGCDKEYFFRKWSLDHIIDMNGYKSTINSEI